MACRIWKTYITDCLSFNAYLGIPTQYTTLAYKDISQDDVSTIITQHLSSWGTLVYLNYCQLPYLEEIDSVSFQFYCLCYLVELIVLWCIIVGWYRFVLFYIYFSVFVSNANLMIKCIVVAYTVLTDWLSVRSTIISCWQGVTLSRSLQE